MACMVDVWVEKRGVDRQVVVVVGVHGGFVGGEARCRPPSGGLGGFVGGDASIAIMTGDPHRHAWLRLFLSIPLCFALATYGSLLLSALATAAGCEPLANSGRRVMHGGPFIGSCL